MTIKIIPLAFAPINISINATFTTYYQEVQVNYVLFRAYKTKVCSMKSLCCAKEILIVDIAIDNEFLRHSSIT